MKRMLFIERQGPDLERRLHRLLVGRPMGAVVALGALLVVSLSLGPASAAKKTSCSKFKPKPPASASEHAAEVPDLEVHKVTDKATKGPRKFNSRDIVLAGGDWRGSARWVLLSGDAIAG
ncbi:MAG: hypothetical protein ACRDKB_09120 [Actinomycetota bacterium]